MKAVLFDWDGTLIDTTEHVYEANVEVMKSFGLPPSLVNAMEPPSHQTGAACTPPSASPNTL